jgi:hypothetical protein
VKTQTLTRIDRLERETACRLKAHIDPLMKSWAGRVRSILTEAEITQNKENLLRVLFEPDLDDDSIMNKVRDDKEAEAIAVQLRPLLEIAKGLPAPRKNHS